MKYRYRGGPLTDPTLIGQVCAPILRADGQPLATPQRTVQAVRFEDGREHVVLGRRLRTIDKEAATDQLQPPRATSLRGAGRTGANPRPASPPEQREAPTRL